MARSTARIAIEALIVAVVLTLLAVSRKSSSMELSARPQASGAPKSGASVQRATGEPDGVLDERSPITAPLDAVRSATTSRPDERRPDIASANDDASAVAPPRAESTRVWEERYAGVASVVLEAHAVEIEKEIYESTKDEFERHFELGFGSQIAEGGRYSGEGYAPTDVSWVKIGSDGRVLRVTLPPEEFPDAYLLKAEAVWLREQAQRREK